MKTLVKNWINPVSQDKEREQEQRRSDSYAAPGRATTSTSVPPAEVPQEESLPPLREEATP